MKNTYYITYNAGNQAEGTSPEATWVEAGDLFVVPKNQTLYLRVTRSTIGWMAQEINMK